MKERVTRRLFDNLLLFAGTIAESQKSLAKLATEMKSEREESEKSSGLTELNVTAVGKVVGNIQTMSTKAREIAESVEALSDRASQIGGIVHLNQGNCRSDQLAGVECRYRSGARRRAGARLCRSGGRGAQAC